MLCIKRHVNAAHDNPATALVESTIDTNETHRRGMNGVILTGCTIIKGRLTSVYIKNSSVLVF
jgi:hypothetical protein